MPEFVQILEDGVAKTCPRGYAEAIGAEILDDTEPSHDGPGEDAPGGHEAGDQAVTPDEGAADNTLITDKE